MKCKYTNRKAVSDLLSVGYVLAMVKFARSVTVYEITMLNISKWYILESLTSTKNAKVMSYNVAEFDGFLWGGRWWNNGWFSLHRFRVIHQRVIRTDTHTHTHTPHIHAQTQTNTHKHTAKLTIAICHNAKRCISFKNHFLVSLMLLETGQPPPVVTVKQILSTFTYLSSANGHWRSDRVPSDRYGPRVSEVGKSDRYAPRVSEIGQSDRYGPRVSKVGQANSTDSTAADLECGKKIPQCTVDRWRSTSCDWISILCSGLD